MISSFFLLNCLTSKYNLQMSQKRFFTSTWLLSVELIAVFKVGKSLVPSFINATTLKHDPTKKQVIGDAAYKVQKTSITCKRKAIEYPNDACQSNGNLFSSSPKIKQKITIFKITLNARGLEQYIVMNCAHITGNGR